MVIRCAGVAVRRAGRTILGPVDWEVRAGERWIVLGRNGSGKTTLVSIASMHLWPTTGSVEVLGERYGRTDARELRRRIGVAGSAVEDAMRPDLTALDLIMTARHGAFEPWWHVYTEADRARATALGERLGLGSHLHQPFSTLSAGERRRASIARALMPDPEILFLDEPTASLDLAARESLMRDLQALARESRPTAVVLVSHHLEEIPPGFGHVLVLAEGRVAAAGPIDDVLRDDVLSDAFGLSLVVEARDGRWTARRRPGGSHPRG